MEVKNKRQNDPQVFIEGFEDLYERDIEKHKSLLERSTNELFSYRNAISYQVQKKKHYKSHLDKGKYNNDALRKSMQMINIDIGQLTNKVKLSQDAIDHHKLIVDTLVKQLSQYRQAQKDFFRNKKN